MTNNTENFSSKVLIKLNFLHNINTKMNTIDSPVAQLNKDVSPHGSWLVERKKQRQKNQREKAKIDETACTETNP